MECIAFGGPNRYTWAVVENEQGRLVRKGEIPHQQGSLWEFLSRCQGGSPVGWRRRATDAKSTFRLSLRLSPKGTTGGRFVNLPPFLHHFLGRHLIVPLLSELMKRSVT